MERFGQQYPLVVGKDKIIIKGNGTYRAAKDILGWTEISVVWSDLSAEEAKAYGIADNQLGSLSEFDLTLLGSDLQDLHAWDPTQDWSALGFDSDQLTPLLGENINDDAGEFEEKKEDKPDMGKPIKLTKDQREIVDNAIAIFRLNEGDNSISEGRVVELLCGDWLAGNGKS